MESIPDAIHFERVKVRTTIILSWSSVRHYLYVFDQIAFSALDIKPAVQAQIYSIVAGILHLGNVKFSGTDSSQVANMDGTLPKRQGSLFYLFIYFVFYL